MSDTLQEGVERDGLRLLDGQLGRPEPMAAEAARGVGRLGGVRGDEWSPARCSTAWGTRTSSAPTTPAASSGCRSASSTPRRGAGRSTGPTRGARASSTRRSSAPFAGDVGVFEGEDVHRGPADPRPLHLVGRDDTDTAMGAGLLRRRRETWETNWVMDFTPDGRRRVSVLEHSTTGSVPTTSTSPRWSARGRASRSATRCSSGTRSRPATRPSRPRSPISRGWGSSTRARLGELRLGGVARLRDPAPLRRELLLPPRLARGRTTTSSGRPSGRRTATTTRSSTRGRSRARTGRRSASGSSARCAHEREAWSRYLRSPRGRDARLEYLRDMREGPV